MIKEDSADALSEVSQHDLDVVIDGVERPEILIADFLTFSRVTTHGKPLATVNASDSLKVAIENLELSVTENHAMITFDELPVVMADTGQLTQLFRNLISNALKY